jgi:hypothetical protein
VNGAIDGRELNLGVVVKGQGRLGVLRLGLFAVATPENGFI